MAGYGPETFATEFPRYESAELAAAYPDFYHESPHNMFLDALTSQGLLGLLALAGFCSLGVLAAIRACRLGNPMAPPLAAALGSGALAAQQFTVFIVTTALYFHLVVAVLVVTTWTRLEARELAERRTQRWLLIPPVVVAALLAAAAVQMIVADRAFAIVQQRIAMGDVTGASEAYRVVLRWQLLGASSDLNYSRAMQQAAVRTPIFTMRLLARQQALEAGIRAVSNAEDRQNAWYNLAALLAQGGDAAGTEQALRNAIAWAPNWFKPHWALAKLLALSGHTDQALVEARVAFERDGGHDPEVAETWKQLQPQSKTRQ